ncbi:acyltransferase family protein [Pseudomonas sp. MWU15-20650]|uniref:acyltransferase family protein n=1 Tax=Pseudomonas sp. MWU15-20650 TaxID=2933107 RepID=UPI00200E1EF8|nr:acyltransferase family protein [Pseudomonas sp. MWU15-20650]
MTMINTARPPMQERSSHQHNQHVDYRPDVDGLRAFAVLAVVIFHAFPLALKGGFIGVDIFFVISGYLISSIIFKSLDKGGVSFVEFYVRRIRRIFPALILMMLACFIAGWFLLMAVEFKFVGKHIAAGIAFVQNIILFQESGYFDTASELKPLLHLWSLGIEEQFYLFFPLVALCVWKIRRLALYVLIICVLLSFGINVSDVKSEPSAAFYLPIGRAWELLIGSLLAYESLYNRCTLTGALASCGVRSELTGRLALWVRNATAVAGFLLLVIALYTIHKGLPFPGARAVAPVLGAALIILAGPHVWLNRSLFSLRPIVWLGLISYPLYLWHWPILTFLKIINVDTPTIGMVLAAVLLSIVLAVATYLFIERPFRLGALSRKNSAILLLLGVIMGATGFTVFVKNGLPERMPEREAFAQYFENSWPEQAYVAKHGLAKTYRLECDFFDFDSYRKGHPTNDPIERIAESCYTPQTNTSVMIWGDSHAQQLYYGLREEIPSEVSILQVATSGCMAYLPNADYPRAKNCEKSNAFALSVIKEKKPAVVIVAQFAGLDQSNDLKALASQLKAYGVGDLIVVGPVPRYDRPLYQLIVRKYWPDPPRKMTTHFVSEVREADESLKQLYDSGQGGFDYLSARDVFCDSEGCLTYLGADPTRGLVTFDYGHLTSIASVFLSRSALAPLVMSKLHQTFNSQKVDPLKMSDE